MDGDGSTRPAKSRYQLRNRSVPATPEPHRRAQEPPSQPWPVHKKYPERISKGTPFKKSKKVAKRKLFVSSEENNDGQQHSRRGRLTPVRESLSEQEASTSQNFINDELTEQVDIDNSSSEASKAIFNRWVGEITQNNVRLNDSALTEIEKNAKDQYVDLLIQYNLVSQHAGRNVVRLEDVLLVRSFTNLFNKRKNEKK